MTLVALLSLSLVLFSFSTKNTTLTQAQCLPDQRHALIQLKQGFNTTQLHSWNASTDCCIWDGITCDEQTGMVTALNLFNRSISGELNPTLFNLSSLHYLNLAWNLFENLILPQTGFEQLANLTHLNLSYSGFAGQVPISISALTHLISLDLSNDVYNTNNPLYGINGIVDPSDYILTNPLYLDDTGLKTLLSNLTKLQVLRLDGVDISLNGSEWANAFSQVGPTLQRLSMVYCGLRGNFPDEIFHLTNLTELHLSFNSMLSGQLPNSIGNMQNLLRLGLYDSGFYGEIPSSITNLIRLEHLYLGFNRFTGTIPLSLFSHPSLKLLYLSDNLFSGYLPEFSNRSSILELFDLSNNNLQGQLPISLFKFPKLTELSLSSNNFTGKFNLDVIKNTKYLHVLSLSNNSRLSIIEGKNHNESFYASFPQMTTINLASCNLTKFPSFLRYQANIRNLVLSNNKIGGVIPNWLYSKKKILFLNLAHNFFTKIEGEAHFTSLERLLDLDIHSNMISGPVPLLPPTIEFVDFTSNYFFSLPPYFLSKCNNLQILDLGNNQIVSRFPFWLGNLKNLRVLVLRSNQFYGTISNMETKTKTNNSFFPSLRVLDLSSNRFRGIIPKIVFENLKAMVTNLDSRTNSRYYLVCPNAITTTLKGQEMEIVNSFIFTSLDLSQNGFSGEIPEEIGQLKSLVALNLSHNVLTGSIPSEFANLHQLQSLDLSFNKLSGHIPQELTSLTFLSALNLSYNNMDGEIPQARQFSTFSNASYLGNPGLCGDPLSMQCPAYPNYMFNKGLHSKSYIDLIGISVSIGVGLGVGFASVIWALVSWENGRKWFNFIVDRFYFRYLH